MEDGNVLLLLVTSDPAGQQCRQKLPSTGHFRHIGFLLSYTFVGLNSALVFFLNECFLCTLYKTHIIVFRLPSTHPAN